MLTSSITQFDIGKITTIKFQLRLIELFNSSTGLSRLATTLPVFTAYIIDFMTICHVVISSWFIYSKTVGKCYLSKTWTLDGSYMKQRFIQRKSNWLFRFSLGQELLVRDAWEILNVRTYIKEWSKSTCATSKCKR